MDYEKTWRDRCYDAGLPDEVPAKLSASGRAPSWKAIAMCILKNDLQLRGLGFGRTDSILVEQLHGIAKARKTKQLSLNLL